MGLGRVEVHHVVRLVDGGTDAMDNLKTFAARATWQRHTSGRRPTTRAAWRSLLYKDLG